VAREGDRLMAGDKQLKKSRGSKKARPATTKQRRQKISKSGKLKLVGKFN
jgi:hypothetical protein